MIVVLMTKISRARELQVKEERGRESWSEMKGKGNLGGRRATDDVYNRADCWKSTGRAADLRSSSRSVDHPLTLV